MYGFVIHPRVGLPRDCGWMSDKLLGFHRVAIEEAARRGLRVLLYDEGMYPSGSSAGQVVERHPDLACRRLAVHDADGDLPAGSNVVRAVTIDGRRRPAGRPVPPRAAAARDGGFRPDPGVMSVGSPA